MEVKVGLFVFIGLALMVALMVWFSKGASLFRRTYILKLHTSNIGGLKPKSAVFLAGVGVGSVQRIQLDASGTNVTAFLQIYQDHPIYHDARFVIEMSGFLGDQYVSVIPTANTLPILTNGADVECEAPFNLQEVARGAAGFVQRLDDTAKRLDASVADLRAQVLNAQTLGNFGASITNLRVFTEQALDTVHDLRDLIGTNRGQVSVVVSNIVLFSAHLDSLLATNGENLTSATKNVQELTVSAQELLNDIQAGKGLAGMLLENSETATNVQLLTENLSIASSNLNRFGLWHFLWAHPAPNPNPPKPVTLEPKPLRQ
ncbi:MAG TPA: MlaD family protein [Candidatus Acidoferrales bacterium]|nr:MlaD family protein [Candidatus Acidoferrales bacterium]